MVMEKAPSLPVHDSLLVPVSLEEGAKAHLTGSYGYFCKITPFLAVHKPPTAAWDF
jgi:hypothetical protein